jgi:phage RecT family recombinase
MTAAPSTDVVTTAPNNPVTIALRNHRAMLEAIVPKSLSIETVLWEAYWAGQKNPELLKCTPVSLVQSTARCLQLGLIIGVTGHLVPFGTECTFIADYKGLIELVVRNGVAASIEARAVYSKDRFRLLQGIVPTLEHEPVIVGQRGELLGAYVIVRHNSMRLQPRFEFRTIDQIEAVRKKSKQWSQQKVGPCPEWYACKTAVRYIMKYLPKSEKMRDVLRILNEDAREEFGDDNELPFSEPTSSARVVEMRHEPNDEQATTGPLYGAAEPEALEPSTVKPALTLDVALAIVYGGKPLGERKDRNLQEIRDWARRRCDQGKGDEDQYTELANACTMILEARERDEGGEHA